jgi:hypothetical protein
MPLPLAVALMMALEGAPAAAPAVPPAAEVVAPPAPDWRDRLVFDALVDTYYAYQVGGAGVQDLEPHLFDQVGNSLTLAYAKLGLGVRPAPVGLRLDLGFGRVADVIASDQAPNLRPDAAAIRFVQQAYVSLVTPGRVPVTFDVGKFVSSAGFEAIEATRNWNYSRTYLFESATPFTLTGLRVSATPVAGLTLTALLVNGWDLVIDNNGDKTFGFGATYAAPTGTTIALSGLAGIETVGAAAPWRLLADLVVTQKLGRVQLALNADAAREGDLNWYGAALFGRVAVASHLNLALRGELFVDHGGRLATNVRSKVADGTFTAAVPIARNAELRAEFRADFADQRLWVVGDTLEYHQLELLAAALAWF